MTSSFPKGYRVGAENAVRTLVALVQHSSAPLAAQRGRCLIHGVSDALRIVIGKGPHASARLVHEPAPRRIEWIHHRQQHVRGYALVGNPVSVAAHTPHLV